MHESSEIAPVNQCKYLRMRDADFIARIFVNR
jgi:hypothetical protein